MSTGERHDPRAGAGQSADGAGGREDGRGGPEDGRDHTAAKAPPVPDEQQAQVGRQAQVGPQAAAGSRTAAAAEEQTTAERQFTAGKQTTDEQQFTAGEQTTDEQQAAAGEQGMSGLSPDVSSPSSSSPHQVPRQGRPVGGDGDGDGELLTRMRGGDDSAAAELFRRHAGGVRRYARTCCRDADTAEDLTAEVFARMLAAVRHGAGPEYAVRAYLLTTVRRVAADWGRTARREQLVDDFAVFAAQAARTSAGPDDDTLDLGADVLAMHEAEQSMAMRAFRSLPERWQAVLWHTEIEDESPSEVAPLFGLDANGTRVLASRAREGLKQAYLQAHVSSALTADEGCAAYADRLGAYARGGLRSRAERGLRKHLEECARCRLAAGQIKEVAGGIPGVVPIAVIGWFGAAGYAKVAALIGGGAGAGAAGAAAAASGSGAAGSGAAGGAASEGVGAPVKIGLVAGAVAAAGVAVAMILAGDHPPKEPEADARPPAVQPLVPEPVPEPEPSTRRPSPDAPAPEPPPAPRPAADRPTPAPSPDRPTPAPTPKPSSAPPRPSPTPAPTPTPTPPAPSPPPTTPAPAPPPPVPAVYEWSTLRYTLTGDGTRPEMRLDLGGGGVWQRPGGMSVGGVRYADGVTVHGPSRVTVELNRPCTAYDAFAGVDDMTLGLGAVRFSVHGDGVPLWSSGIVRGGDPAVPVHVGLAGRRTVQLVVEPVSGTGAPLDRAAAVADWARSRFTCG